MVSPRMFKKKIKFKELAEKRVLHLLHGLRLLQNLSNKNNYEYTDAQTLMIFNKLKQALNETERAFKSSNNRIEEFSLSGPEDTDA